MRVDKEKKPLLLDDIATVDCRISKICFKYLDVLDCVITVYGVY